MNTSEPPEDPNWNRPRPRKPSGDPRQVRPLTGCRDGLRSTFL